MGQNSQTGSNDVAAQEMFWIRRAGQGDFARCQAGLAGRVGLKSLTDDTFREGIRTNSDRNCTPQKLFIWFGRKPELEVRSLVSVNRNIFQHFRSCSCTGGTKKSTDPDCFCFLLDQVVTDHLGGANTKAALWVTFGWICAEIQAQVFFQQDQVALVYNKEVCRSLLTPVPLWALGWILNCLLWLKRLCSLCHIFFLVSRPLTVCIRLSDHVRSFFCFCTTEINRADDQMCSQSLAVGLCAHRAGAC